MRPVGRGIEVSVLGERILKSGAKKHSLEIRCLTVYDMVKTVTVETFGVDYPEPETL